MRKQRRPGFFTFIRRALFEKQVVVPVADRLRIALAADRFEDDPMRLAKIRACGRR